jgi:hypothetical protein
MKFFKKKQQQPELKPSNPYILEIKNTTDEVKEWILFGANRYLNQPNNGNPVGVEISDLQGNNGYQSLLQEMDNSEITIGNIRIMSNNQKNLTQKVQHHLHNSAGGFCEISYVRRDLFLAICKDAYQQQSDIIETTIPKEFNLNSKVHLSGTIEPNSSFTITIFPSKINEEEFKFVRLTGKNVAPVIIQTFRSGNPTIFSRIVNFFKFKWFLIRTKSKTNKHQ